MFTLIIVLIVIAIVTIFSVQNAAPVAISFLSWRFESSLAIVVFLFSIVGIVIGITAASIFRIRSQRQKSNKDEVLKQELK